MSALVDLFNTSKGRRVAQARKIPSLHVNYFDVTNTFEAGGFQLNETKSEPTQFTPFAQNYYTTELNSIVIPAGFIPTSTGIALNRWNPTTPYNTPDALGFKYS